jgi:hypothetical protein
LSDSETSDLELVRSIARNLECEFLRLM